MNCVNCNQTLGKCHYNRKYCDICVKEKNINYQKQYRKTKRKSRLTKECQQIWDKISMLDSTPNDYNKYLHKGEDPI